MDRLFGMERLFGPTRECSPNARREIRVHL
jgi:hypothetical protein